MLYPQNGDSIVTIYSVTSFHRVYNIGVDACENVSVGYWRPGFLPNVLIESSLLESQPLMDGQFDSRYYDYS